MNRKDEALYEIYQSAYYFNNLHDDYYVIDSSGSIESIENGSYL